MPVMIACTSCKALFNVDESTLGKTVKCPKCQSAFLAVAASGFTGQAPTPAPTPPAGGYQPGAPPVPPPGYGAPPGYAPPGYGGPPGYGDYGVNIAQPGGNLWNTTTTGIRLLQISTIALLVGTLIASLINIIKPVDPFQPQAVPDGAQMFQSLLGCVILIFLVVAFVGSCMCLTVPYPPAKKKALTGFLLGIGALVMALIGFVVLVFVVVGAIAQNPGMQPGPEMFLRAGVPGIVIGAIILGMMIAATVFWMFFHAAIGDYFQDAGLRKLSMIAMVVFIGVLLVGIVFGVISMMGGPGSRVTMARISGIWSLIAGTLQYGLYTVVCSKSLAAIKRGSRM